MSRVSILIPTYNRAHYLPETLASALQQTFRDIEVIVVDDGSTDDTAQVVRATPDPRVRYIYQENRGVSAALNTAWRAARGEYVAMLGSDDVMLPTQIETLLQHIERDAAIGLVYARAQAMDAQSNPLPQILGSPPKFAGRELASLLYGDCICGIACLVRRAILERVGGFDETLIANEDWDLWIRMAEISRLAFHDEILARYRMHPTSLTGGRSKQYRRVILDRMRLIENYYSRANVPPDALAIKSLARRNVYMDVGIRFLAIGAVGDAIPYLERAIRAHGNPIAATFRVTGVALFDLYLSKTRWGVRLVNALVARRRKTAVV
ncbi:MAG: glycosyltransferase [Chloroflexi bacterium]|nr:glycosyltransferase [Chloroflexota bacterium]